jgi:hypothetical protein
MTDKNKPIGSDNGADKGADNGKKMSNAKVALFITMIPVMLFIVSFFIQRG